jgi:hypothetical protein
MLHEYRTVLLRPRLRSAHGLGPEQIDDLLTEIVANAIWRDPAAFAASEAAPDPGDQYLWALLALEPAALRVSGDRLLLQKPKAGADRGPSSVAAAPHLSEKPLPNAPRGPAFWCNRAQPPVQSPGVGQAASPPRAPSV